MSSIEIFFSYADKDKELLGELEKHLTFLKSERRVTGWHNRKIVAGQQWAREIETHLNTAQIILLLISPDFVASEYCYSGEMKRAMERHERGQAHVIPIILRPVHWQGAPFGKLQPLPTDAKPIISSNWHYPDEAFFNVAEGIIKVVEELMKKPSSWQQPQAAQFSHMLEEKDVSPIPSGREREALYQLADAYRKMRYDLHPGPERTSLMTSLVEQMRALAPLVTFSPDEMNRLLQSKKQEEERRLLGLALIRGSGGCQVFWAGLADYR